MPVLGNADILSGPGPAASLSSMDGIDMIEGSLQKGSQLSILRVLGLWKGEGHDEVHVIAGLGAAVEISSSNCLRWRGDAKDFAFSTVMVWLLPIPSFASAFGFRKYDVPGSALFVQVARMAEPRSTRN